MITPHHGRYSEAQRMELRSYVNLAGEVVARLWPMRTFISRNPLQGLEHLPFEDAVARGKELFGGQSYASEEFYRKAFQAGEIKESDLDSVLGASTSEAQVYAGARCLSHLDVLRAALIHGIHAPLLEDGPGYIDQSRRDDQALGDRTRQWIQQALDPILEGTLPPVQLSDEGKWPFHETASTWCDRTWGTELTDCIDRQMIKWCAAFCDEGEAAWPMPHREQTFFRAWKLAARHDLNLRGLGIKNAAEKILALSDRPEDVVLESLERLKVPPVAWQDYLSLHLAALPGWVGFIKWRSEQTAYPWQQSYRIDLNKYLAVRLFYERELVENACRRHLKSAGHVAAIDHYAREFPYAVWVRRAVNARILSPSAIREAARLQRWWRRTNEAAWDNFGRRWYEAYNQERKQAFLSGSANAIIRLIEVLKLEPATIPEASPRDLMTLLSWIRSFTPSQRRQKWLEAFELSGQLRLLKEIRPQQTHHVFGTHDIKRSVRPLAQFVFCIDVRSEVFRRHLEIHAGYETFGFAGFFGVPVSYRSLDQEHEVELCPVLLKPKHVLREVPRTYQDSAARRRKTIAKTVKAGQELLQDLKHNVITPYVMVEAIGWFFAWPLLGKTFFPTYYHRISGWIQNLIMPPVATALTVDKLTREEAQEMLAAEQRMQILRWFRERHQIPGHMLTPERLERIRLQALEATERSRAIPGDLGHLLTVLQPHEETILEDLRRECQLTERDSSFRVERLSRTGMTENEQAYYVETALRLMGMTSGFGRLVFVCAHGSTSDNNPYESALDCGACGGSHGLPNARTFATIANRPKVRELLAKRGIAIPADTCFVAALHDTTTDSLRVSDLEDFPLTHRKELAQVLDEIHAASLEAAAERHAELSPSPTIQSSYDAIRAVSTRSVDWSQVRPEWGLARNSFFIIAQRKLTLGSDLGGRAFLHSYDHRTDPDGRLLEFIMTAPLIVAQWINAEYYFSTVDPDVYGSGSKVYHNVTGRIGVMSGNHGDLRMGLPIQTVMDGSRPYHEPARLTALIEAPRERITAIITRQPLLKKLFNNRWLRLAALDPEDGQFYSYEPAKGQRGGTDSVWVNTTFDERNQDRGAGRALEVHY